MSLAVSKVVAVRFKRFVLVAVVVLVTKLLVVYRNSEVKVLSFLYLDSRLSKCYFTKN